MANSGGNFEPQDIKAWLAANSDRIKAVFDEDTSKVGTLDVKVQAFNPYCFILHVWTGDTHKRIKAYNPNTERLAGYCSRETKLLGALNDTGLAPRLYDFDTTENWYISDWIVGSELHATVTPDNIVAASREVGQWLAKYAQSILKVDAFSEAGKKQHKNWRDYLVNYGGVIEQAALDPEADFLEDLTLDTRIVAKDDPHFGNYIRAEDGTLFGIDFEMSTLRPYGWDVMVTARALLRTYPGPQFDHIDALVDGWAQGTDCIDQESFRKLVRWFAEKTAFDVNNPTVEGFRQILHAYNANATVPAAKIMQVPGFENEIDAVGADVSQALTARIRSLINNADQPLSVEEYLASDTTPQDSGTADVSLRLAKTCETCEGSCCSRGTQNLAYLKEDAIYRTAHYLGTKSLAHVIDAYVNHVPEHHVKNSCFYHTSTGCALPREMRSTICNMYQCGAAQAVSKMTSELDPDVPIIVVAGHHTEVKRAYAVSEQLSKKLDVKIANTHTNNAQFTR